MATNGTSELFWSGLICFLTGFGDATGLNSFLSGTGEAFFDVGDQTGGGGGGGGGGATPWDEGELSFPFTCRLLPPPDDDASPGDVAAAPGDHTPENNKFFI